MKSIFKLVVSHFFIITVCVLFFVSLSNSIVGVKSYPPDYPWSILLTGFVGALPSFLFYFKNEPTKLRFYVRVVIHFIVLSSLIMSLGFLMGWFSSFAEGLIVFGIFFVIYVFVWIFSNFSNQSIADSINTELSRLNNISQDNE